MAPKIRPPMERFTEHTRAVENGCIEWTAYRGENGYGRFYVDGRGALAHRWAYETAKGAIPEGMQIDHLCRNRACVNPDHLEPVTGSENVRRAVAASPQTWGASRVTFCPRGHEYTEENTYTSDGGHGRTCLTCKRMLGRRHYEANRAAYLERAAAQRRAK